MDSHASKDIYRVINRYLFGTGQGKKEAGEILKGHREDSSGIIEGFISSLPKNWRQETPSRKAQKFSHPLLKDKYPDFLLFFNIPASYSPTEPFRLLIFMHGGGAGVPLDSGYHYLTDHPVVGMSPVIDTAPCITVAPSAPFPRISNDRWAKGGAEDYLGDVIEECLYRFNIDPHKISLGGMSMGGSGAYALMNRMGDRFASVLAASGSWRQVNFSCMAGTPLCILHGTNDAAPCVRPRFTDIFCAHTAHLLLEEENIEHLYLPHNCGHTIAAEKLGHPLLKKALDYTLSHTRDPFFPRVVNMTPCSTVQFYEEPDIESPHYRWLSINEIGTGRVETSGKKLSGPYPNRKETAEDFAKQSFSLVKEKALAGIVEAVHREKNYFECIAKNVRAFSIWLHPAMADFSKPVRVSVNGKMQEFQNLAPSLLTALQSYERRRDRGLIYPCRIDITVPD